jgi:hypothetical protein
VVHLLHSGNHFATHISTPITSGQKGNDGTSGTSGNGFWSGSTTGAIWNINSGNVGIGTTSPSEKFVVKNGNILVSGGTFSIEVTNLNLSGSTSGNTICNQPFVGSSYKKVIIYCDALLGTVTYTYPTAFLYTPQILSQNLTAIVTSISNTSVTLTGSTSTGFIELSGF